MVIFVCLSGSFPIITTALVVGLAGNRSRYQPSYFDAANWVSPCCITTVDMTTSSGPPLHFFLMLNGQIESADVCFALWMALIFVQIPGSDNLYCHYSYHMGQDWTVVGGPEEGLTQIGQAGGPRHSVVWNFPIDVTFKSSNAFGWPQIVLAVYGLDGFGRDVIRGYGAVHLPTVPGRHEVTVALFTPQSASPLQRLTAWIGAAQAEFVDPKLPAKHAGREVVRVSSAGSVRLLLNVVAKDMALVGYAVGSVVQQE